MNSTGEVEHVILVNSDDTPLGTDEKLAAHQRGTLHRAFSVFIFNSRGDMLLQQRAFDKYHSGGLWTNACCSHPRPGEQTPDAAHRRLREELGFDCPLTPTFSFEYRAVFEDGLCEHELDHVFVGMYDGVVTPDADEIAAIRWVSIPDLQRDLKAKPERYTVWFRLAFDQTLAYAPGPG